MWSFCRGSISTHIILSLVAWCRVAVNATLLFEPVRFFVDAAQENPSGGKILLEQKQAVQQWDKLLQGFRAGADVAGDQPLHPAPNEKGHCCSHHAIHAEAV